jgi:thioredoxin 1
MSMSEPIHVTDAEFENKVLKSPLPVIVDFWAAWCSPCRAIAPALEHISTEYDGRLVVAKVDVDENPLYAQRFGVQGIPTLLLMYHGKELGRIVGAVPEAKIKASIADFLQQSGSPGSGLATPSPS